jgi:transcriptional regulator with XRE-family HTH domain
MRDETGIIATVAENVRRRREAAGLSQEQLGFEARLDRTYVSQVERRQRNVTIVVLAKLATALETTAASLLQPPRK